MGIAPSCGLNRDDGKRKSGSESATEKQQRSFQLSAVVGGKGLWVAAWKRQRISAVTRISELPSDRRASHGAREYMSREKPQQLIPVMRCLMLPRPSDGHRTTISKSGVSRGAPILCPRRDQWRPLSFPVRQSDAEHQHALRPGPCEYRLREYAGQPHRKSLRTGRAQTT